MAEVDFLRKLRQATSELHKAVEGLPISIDLMHDDVSWDHYVRYLTCMMEIASHNDREVLPKVTELIPETERRYKSTWIRKDLEILAPEALRLPFPKLSCPPSITSTEFALGMAYVMEGSTLGGQVILKHLRAKFGAKVMESASFLSGYGSKTGSMWQAFLVSLNRYSTLENQDTIISGALACFNMIHNHLRENSVA